MSFLYIRTYLSVVDDNRCPISIYSRFLIALFVLGIGLSASVIINALPLNHSDQALLNEGGTPTPVQGKLEAFPRDYTLNSLEPFGSYRIPLSKNDSFSGTQRHFVEKQTTDPSVFSMGKSYPENLKMSDIDNNEKPSLPSNYGGVSEEEFLKFGYRRHTTVNGDCLDDLAEKYLNDANRWQEIYELNKSELSNKDVIPIGIVLIIPAK